MSSRPFYGLCSSATSRGAQRVVGGKPLSNMAKGHHHEPTVFERGRNKMRVAREVIFGPVVAVIRCEGSGRGGAPRQRLVLVAGVPACLQPAMVRIDTVRTIDVVDKPLSDSLSLESEHGLRFLLREGLPPWQE